MGELFGKHHIEVGESKCGGCERGSITITSRCIECAANLCDICTNSHKRLKGTASHRVIGHRDYDELKTRSPAVIHPPVNCSLHPSHPMTFYCHSDTCDVPICPECTELAHARRHHNYRYVYVLLVRLVIIQNTIQ